MKVCPFPWKQQHRTQADAIAHLMGLRRKDGAFTAHAYRCGNHWHVGHRTRTPRRRRHR